VRQSYGYSVHAVRVAPFVAGSSPVVSPEWLPWVNLGLTATAVYLLLAPILLMARLFQRTLAFPGADVVLLFIGVGGAAAASMIPVGMMALGGSFPWSVSLWSTLCLIAAMFWCWRFRRLLI
jgi:hypothetical protein